MSKRLLAVFTIAQNEPNFLPVWVNYYTRQVAPGDLYVLDHDDGYAAVLVAGRFEPFVGAGNIVPVHNDASFDHVWLRDTVQAFQRFLLQSYEWVLFTEADEVVAANPREHPGGLRAYLRRVGPEWDALRAGSFEVVQDVSAGAGEPPLDWDRPLLAQRRLWSPSTLYAKTLLSRVPLTWGLGFHDLLRSQPGSPPFSNRVYPGQYPAADPSLALLHLHRVDFAACLAKHQEQAVRPWNEADVRERRGFQNRIGNPVEFARWYGHPEDFGLEALRPVEIPGHWKGVV